MMSGAKDGGKRGLRKNLLSHVSVDIGEAVVTAGVAVGQVLMVDAQEME